MKAFPIGLGLQDSASLQFSWIFSSATDSSDPGANTFKFNNSDPALVTEIYLSSVAYPNRNVANILGQISQGDRFYAQERISATSYINCDVISAPIDNGTYWTIPVSVFDSEDSFTPNQFCDFLIYHVGGGGGSGGGGLSEDEVVAIAAGSTLGLEQALLSNAGQPGKTVLAVGYTDTGKVQGTSLGEGNVIEVFANGADFNANVVLYREFLNFGETICFTGLGLGAIITSSQGFYGFCEQEAGSDVSPMPLLSYGLSFTSTFFFAFRQSENLPPAASNQGWVHVVAGPLKTKVTLKRGTGVVVDGQENIEVEPWSYLRLFTNGNTEFILEATNPIMACIAARMNNSGSGRYSDSRLIMPLTNDGITWPRSGNVSAPFDNTLVNYYVRDGATGNFTVSPGSPVDFDSSSGTGANDADYEPDGATRVKAVGLISAYSGADGAGSEATPLMPTSAMSQLVAQPIFISDIGDGGSSGLAIASPYEGTAKVYEWNFATGELDLAYTVPLLRNIGGTSTRNDQNFPSSGQVANETTTGSIDLVGNLNPGVVIADVPITLVTQSNLPPSEGWPLIRSQNGTTTEPILNNDDETLSLGITPDNLKAEITEGEDGILYKRTLAAGGVENWVIA